MTFFETTNNSLLTPYRPIVHPTFTLQFIMSSASFITDLLSPGGGMQLIPFIRVVVMLLFAICLACFVAGVARIHMLIMSFLSAGLLVSLSFFQAEFNRVNGRRQGTDDASGDTAASSSSSESDRPKTD